MSLVAKTLWIIERNTDQTLSLNELAELTGVSRSHLANAFGSATGMPVIKYLRARRLGRAAQALARGAPDILSVALDAGYSSHEAFTRAFRDLFGTTPESVRERRSIKDLPFVEPLELKPEAGTRPPQPRFVDQGEVRAVGLSAPYNFANTIGIPAQWQRFMAMCDDIPYQKQEIPIGINQVPDETGQFRYVCAVEVERFGNIAAEMEAIRIPATRYAVFDHSGHVSALYKTYAQIWNQSLPDAGCVVADAPIIEHHNPTFDTMSGQGGLTLWIPVQTGAIPSTDRATQRNRETVKSYGRYASAYAAATNRISDTMREAMDRFATGLPAGASILEIGSGPGWDADYLESKGLSVHRTDASPEFVALQRQRGKSADVLDLIGDAFGGPYDGLLMLYVLQHIDDALLPDALGKMAGSLTPGGLVLLTMREGDELVTEHARSGDYHSTLRTADQFRAALAQATLDPEWAHQDEDEEGTWQIMLARRR